MRKTLRAAAVLAAIGSTLGLAVYAIDAGRSDVRIRPMIVRILAAGEPVAELRFLRPLSLGKELRFIGGDVEIRSGEGRQICAVNGEDGATLKIEVAGRSPIMVTAQEMQFELPVLQGESRAGADTP